MTRRGLGKGLDALIPGDFQPESAVGAHQILISLINPNPTQPRTDISDDSLQEMMDSIREHGIIQPLIVTKNEGDDHYTLIAGERRLRAAALAGLESVPAIVREASEQERLELALIENLQREDLSPIEAASAYQKLQDEFSLSQEQIAERVGKSRVAVTNTIRLLKLPESVQLAVLKEEISEGHARALLALNTRKSQEAALGTILRNELNVRQTEELVRKLSGQKVESGKIKAPKPAEIKSLEDLLRDHLGTKVSVNHSKKGGTIVIHYYSDEELDMLIRLMMNQE